MTRVALDVSVNEHIAIVTVQGPGKGNAQGPDFWRECPEVFAELDRDERVRVIVLRGKGSTFSYGLDLIAMAGDLGPLLSMEVGAQERLKLLDVIHSMQGGPRAVARCRKPVIAAVHGWCIGGALDLLSACDVRVCSAGARFSLREVKVAMVADVGSLQRLPHIIGEAATRELALTGRDIDAQRALQLGLVSQVFADDDALFLGALQLARDIAHNPPLVVQGIKRVMNDRIDGDIEAGLRHVAVWNAAFLASVDLQEALAAFVEKREPRYQGK